MRNALVKARRLAFFEAIESASAYRFADSPRHVRVTDPWFAIALRRRMGFLSGSVRPNPTNLEHLLGEYPQAAAIWHADAWKYLDPDTSDASCESRLYQECGLRRSQCSAEELLERYLEINWSDGAHGLGLVSRSILALRVARTLKNAASSPRAAALLAAQLLVLTGCIYRQTASGQIWDCCRRLVPHGVSYRTWRMRFNDHAWHFIAAHARSVTEKFRETAYASPQRSELPFAVIEELLRDVVMMVTTEDCDRAEFILSRFNTMSPDGHFGKPLPKLSTISIWAQPVS